ncbi:MAG: dipicolinate synthase subunit B [Clostridia bacterium]|nr:dipicolinate synthase subunit B [Oscillospiraceae bacterium]MBQ7960640.1 dipicolinate synthase subunit B [Clostridia bacterium]
MKLCDATVGFAITGSFCTFSKVFPKIEELAQQCRGVVPIMSEISYTTDTRFGTAEENRKRFESITGRKIIASVKDAEPIGPKKMLDILVVAPCTGNSLAKIATGIADTSVTMAVKSHLRNKRPVVIAISTNDGLGNNAKNIGYLSNMKNIYIVPFGQDDSETKENSLVADMNFIIPTTEAALDGKQLQPMLKIYE